MINNSRFIQGKFCYPRVGSLDQTSLTEREQDHNRAQPPEAILGADHGGADHASLPASHRHGITIDREPRLTTSARLIVPPPPRQEQEEGGGKVEDNGDGEVGADDYREVGGEGKGGGKGRGRGGTGGGGRGAGDSQLAVLHSPEVVHLQTITNNVRRICKADGAPGKMDGGKHIVFQLMALLN